MLRKQQENLIRRLQKKRGRRDHGLCLVEGKKIISELEEFIDFTFTSGDTKFFKEFTSTKTPQDMIAVAHLPDFNLEDVFTGKPIILLDHVQDPGNVGAFFRLAQAFDATLILRECADAFSPKVIRASAGASFRVPNISCNTEEAFDIIKKSGREVYRMELNKESSEFKPENNNIILIFGNEGNGILGNYKGKSVHISHNGDLESLSVSHAGAIALYLTNQL